MSQRLADQEELKVTDDTEARDLDGATGGDVVADTGEIPGELAGGGGSPKVAAQ